MKIDKDRFFYVVIGLMILDLIIDGIDDFGTTLYLVHFLRSAIIVGVALVASIRLKNGK